MVHAWLGFCVLISVTSSACLPTSARTNAKLEPGVDFAVAVGGQQMLEGKDGAGQPTDAESTGHLEAAVQLARVWDSGSGLAVQLKVPINFFYSSLDFYYQLSPLAQRTYAGAGVELGIAPGVYGSITRYFGGQVFATFTQRVLLSTGNVYLINPQLALGYAGPGLELSVFAAYAHATGEGVDVDIDLFSDEDNKDYRMQFGMVGVGLRL